MRYFILLFFCNLSLSVVAQNTQTDGKKLKGPFVHTVLFYMNDPSDTESMAKFEDGLREFINSSKYVLSSHFGKPAGTERPVVDNTYTYCLIVTFQSKDEHDLYQNERVHKDFIAQYSDLWDRVQIFDSIEI